MNIQPEAAPAEALNALADIAGILAVQADARDLTSEFNYLDRYPPQGTHALLHNVSLTSVQDLQTGHVIPILRGPTWDDISVVGFYQVVQGSDFGRTFIQLITEIPMPPLGIIKHDQMLSVYAINRYGLLNFNILVTKKDAANIEAIPASESTVNKQPSTISGLFTQGHTTHSFSSKSVAQQKEEAKFIALKRIYLNNETQIRAFVGTRFSVDDHTTSTSCIMRLPSSLRDLPAFSLENMPSFVTMRFSHIRGVKSAWHIDLMTSADSGPFRSTTGVFHAVINLKLAFQLIFQDLITNEPNRLIDLALTQWEHLLLNQDAFTSFKHLRLDFIVDELMMSLCKMAQMFNDPRLDGIKDKTAASALLAEATRVDEADIMRKGTMLLLTDQKREKFGKPLAIAPPNKKQRMDTPRAGGGSGKSFAGTASSSSSSVAPQGRVFTQPCLNNIQHLVIGAPYDPCRNEGKTCKFEHGPLPTLFDSPSHKAFIIKSASCIRNEKTRGVVVKHLEGIPAKP